MSIKAGQILHVGNGLLIDRIQTAGVTGLNVNEERLEELGNFEAVGTIRDIPDLTFEIESYDPGTELEEMLVGLPGNSANGTLIDLTNNGVPLDVISPYKNPGLFTIVRGVAIPFLTLESLSYNFTLNDPMTQTATLRGDSVFYIPGSVFREGFVGDGALVTFTYTNGPAFVVTIDSAAQHLLGVTVDGVRQKFGVDNDYTTSTTQITFNTAPANTADIQIVYGSAVASTYSGGVAAQGTLTMDTIPTDADTLTLDAKTYTFQTTLTDVDGNIAIGGSLAQAKLNLIAAVHLSGNAGTDYADSMTVHPTVRAGTFIVDAAIFTAKTVGIAGNSIVTTETFTPVTNVFDAATLGTTTAGVDTVHGVNTGGVAVRGRNVRVTVADSGGGNPVIWTGVQATTVEWRVTLERDEEFDNAFLVTQDFDVPEVSGTITLKPADATVLVTKIQQSAGLTGTNIVTASEDPPKLEITVEVLNPSTGANLKTIVVEDAKMVVPSIQPAVGAKLEVEFPWTSAAGLIKIYVGDKP